MQFSIKQSQLKALLTLAPKSDIRYYLCGIFVEYNATTTRLVVTDGHKLGILNHHSEDNQGIGSLIIPREVIENLPKAGKIDPLLIFTKEEKQGYWKITGMGIQTIFAQIEGTYPDYRRVCQFTTDGTVANYNYEYLTQFLKVQHLLGGSKTATLNLYQNGNSSALVHLAGVDQYGLNTACFEEIVKRNPVHRRALHRDGFRALARQPFDQLLQLLCGRAEHAYIWLSVLPRRTTNPMLAAAHVDPGHHRADGLQRHRHPLPRLARIFGLLHDSPPVRRGLRPKMAI